MLLIHLDISVDAKYQPLSDLPCLCSCITGEATGSSIDYASGVLGIKYSYGVELRDQGMFGHLLPPDQIIPTAEEALAGALQMGRIVLEEAEQERQRRGARAMPGDLELHYVG